MKVFITGATGFLGKHLTEECIKKKFKVSIFTRKVNLDKKREFLKKIEKKGVRVYYGDLKNFNDIKNAIKENFDIIFHLASVPKNDRENFEVDVKGTKNLLKAILENGIRVKKIFFMSTAAVYGPQKLNKPIDEKTKCKPNSDYGLFKYKAENIIKRFCKKNKINYIIIRSPRIYGPGDWQKTFLNYIKLQKFGISLVLDKLSINLIYVKNLVHFIFLSLKSKNEIFVASDEKTYSFEEVERIISSLIKSKPKIRITIPRVLLILVSKLTGMFAYSINNVRFSVEKAKKELGYKDIYSLKDGLRETIKWYKSKGFL
jgi:nucleoside-diphosphate-sugar epimerase